MHGTGEVCEEIAAARRVHIRPVPLGTAGLTSLNTVRFSPCLDIVLICATSFVKGAAAIPLTARS
jgi:hypothetical protein